jgi:hypothetical protein
MNQSLNCIGIKLELILPYASLIDSPSQQMLIEYLLLLVICVAIQVYLLHTIKEWLGYMPLVVSRTDE